MPVAALGSVSWFSIRLLGPVCQVSCKWFDSDQLWLREIPVREVEPAYYWYTDLVNPWTSLAAMLCDSKCSRLLPHVLTPCVAFSDCHFLGHSDADSTDLLPECIWSVHYPVHCWVQSATPMISTESQWEGLSPSQQGSIHSSASSSWSLPLLQLLPWTGWFGETSVHESSVNSG